MELQLTDQQAELLQNILDHAFRELRSEVVATDNPAFKHELRVRVCCARCSTWSEDPFPIRLD